MQDITGPQPFEQSAIHKLPCGSQTAPPPGDCDSSDRHPPGSIASAASTSKMPRTRFELSPRDGAGLADIESNLRRAITRRNSVGSLLTTGNPQRFRHPWHHAPSVGCSRRGSARKETGRGREAGVTRPDLKYEQENEAFATSPSVRRPCASIFARAHRSDHLALVWRRAFGRAVASLATGPRRGR